MSDKHECNCNGSCGDDCKCKESENVSQQEEDLKHLNICRICKSKLNDDVKSEFNSDFLYKSCSKCKTVNVLTSEQKKAYKENK